MDKEGRFSDEAYKLAAIAAKYWDAYPSPREQEEVQSRPIDAAEWAVDLLLACEEALAK